MTIKTLLENALAQLGADKRLEAQLLLAFVLRTNRASLLAHADDVVASEAAGQFQRLLDRLAQGEPLQYLLGSANFMGLELLVNSHVLIPRFDTEILAEAAIAWLNERPSPKALDICTGSGAIAISMAKYAPQSEIWAGDISPEALAVAGENSRRLGVAVHLRQGDLFTPFAADHMGYFDLITANPPYITAAEMDTLPPDVQHEPALALLGGVDGLDFYRRIIPAAQNLLTKDGRLLLEIGYTQGAAVAEMLERAGYQQVEVLKDYQGHDRVVSGLR